MRSSTSHLPRIIPKTFNELNAIHPLRPINDKIDLKNSEEMLDRLAILNKRTKDQNDYLQTLILLTETFEGDQIQDAMNSEKSSGVEALKYLMESAEMSQTSLAKLLKVGASAVSMILSEERPITAGHARALGKHFNISPAVFL
jgi:antitoxin component HigA of HigAB toxin-antitoxin module